MLSKTKEIILRICFIGILLSSIGAFIFDVLKPLSDFNLIIFKSILVIAILLSVFFLICKYVPGIKEKNINEYLYDLTNHV